MNIGQTFTYPEEQQKQRERAKKLSWLSIALLVSAGILLFFTLGQSEAMKTAWISDILTAIPPAALLLAMHYELRAPSKRFPYGYTRAIGVAFLVTSGVLSLIGLYLLYDALMKLVMQQRPPIGTMVLFGHQFWAGWAMIVSLSYSLLCGLTIGLLKKPVAKKLSDKALHAEATMNRDEWLSEGAAIIGIVLVAFGHWWGDAAAAAFIAIEIIHDGWMNTRLVIGDLMDESPTKMGDHALEEVTAKVRDRVEELEWVSSAGVRLREHGRVLVGDVFVVLDDDTDVIARSAAVADSAREVDWRLHDITVMPVSHLDAQDPPKLAHGSRPRGARRLKETA
ncbi:MAG: cation transporter [Gemmatimonadaceae bacterium]